MTEPLEHVPLRPMTVPQLAGPPIHVVTGPVGAHAQLIAPSQFESMPGDCEQSSCAAVLLTVPLGILGAVVAASMRGLPNDVYFTVGLITIIGLAAKDAILIIEFAKDLRAQGRPLVEATVEACSLRFRPIVMTGLAFVFGVFPMVIATGAGGASQQALGTSVMGGMIAVVILALLMVPVFFVSVQRLLGGDRARTSEKEVGRLRASPHGAAE